MAVSITCYVVSHQQKESSQVRTAPVAKKNTTMTPRANSFAPWGNAWARMTCKKKSVDLDETLTLTRLYQSWAAFSELAILPSVEVCFSNSLHIVMILSLESIHSKCDPELFCQDAARKIALTPSDLMGKTFNRIQGCERWWSKLCFAPVDPSKNGWESCTNPGVKNVSRKYARFRHRRVGRTNNMRTN